MISDFFLKIYQTMSICTRTLETVCKFDPRRWHLNGSHVIISYYYYYYYYYGISTDYCFSFISIIIIKTLLWVMLSINNCSKNNQTIVSVFNLQLTKNNKYCFLMSYLRFVEIP
jgi:hypothetical protein